MNQTYRQKPVVIAVLAALGCPVNSVFAAPQDGQITAGAANISQTGNTTTINQSSQNAAINWTSFSVGATEAVRFNQPNTSSITLNRVTGLESSQILGSLTANGQVFILNPNGVMFGAGAQVNVGGLVASSLHLSDADFMAGNFKFSGTGTGSVINQGNIKVAEGGTLALIAPVVQNTGTLTAPQGNVLLAAGDAVTLKLQDGKLLAYTLDKGAVQALVDNGGLIKADGGQVILTAKGQDALSRAVVNHSGIIEAQTVSNKSGVVELLGDMAVGEVNVSGKIDASAPNGSDGGFVETSAAKVNVADSARIITEAANGKTGNWLIDPNDYTIAATGGNITGTALGNNLGTSNVTISTATQGTAGGLGDIFVNDSVSWSANKVLTLTAQRYININAPITATGDSAGVALNHSGDYFLNGGKITLSGANATFAVNGTNYTLIHDVNQLQAMKNNLAGNYVLGNDINATTTSSWNSGAGFLPIGVSTANYFKGIFDGLGHIITGLTVKRPLTDNAGLFGITADAKIRNVGLMNGSITGRSSVGGLVGYNYTSIIDNVYFIGNVVGSEWVGGLIGYNLGLLSNGYVNASVSGNDTIGGVVGFHTSLYGGKISNVYATGSVNGNLSVAGLVGTNYGLINDSFWNTQTTGKSNAVGVLSTGTLTNVLGKTTAQMQQKATFTNWNISNTGGSSAIWRIYEGQSAPLLRSFLTPLTVTSDNFSKTYDGQAYTGSLSNPVYSVTGAASSSHLFNLTTPYANAVNVGTYNPPKLYSDQQGYDISQALGTLTINPAILNLSGSRTYDGTVKVNANILTLNGLQNGETLNLSGAGTIADKNVGSKVVSIGTLALSNGTGLASNYTFTGSTGLVTINPATLNLSGIRPYDGTTNVNANIFTLSGLVNGETLNLAGVGTIADKNVGWMKPVSLGTLALSNGTGLASNYTLTSGTHKADVTAVAVSNSSETSTDLGGVSAQAGNPGMGTETPVATQDPVPSSIHEAFWRDDPAKGVLDYLKSKGVSSATSVAISYPITLIFDKSKDALLKQYAIEYFNILGLSPNTFFDLQPVFEDVLSRPSIISYLKSAPKDLAIGFLFDALGDEVKRKLNISTETPDGVWRAAGIDVLMMAIKNAIMSSTTGPGFALAFQIGFTSDMASFAATQAITVFTKAVELGGAEDKMHQSAIQLAIQSISAKNRANEIFTQIATLVNTSSLEDKVEIAETLRAKAKNLTKIGNDGLETLAIEYLNYYQDKGESVLFTNPYSSLTKEDVKEVALTALKIKDIIDSGGTVDLVDYGKETHTTEAGKLVFQLLNDVPFTAFSSKGNAVKNERWIMLKDFVKQIANIQSGRGAWGTDLYGVNFEEYLYKYY